MTSHPSAHSSLASRLRSVAQFHVRNAAAALRYFSPWILLVPAIAMWLIIVDSRTGFGWFEEKSTQEILAPTVLSVAIFIAALFWARAGGFYSRWLLLLSIALFCRELHFWGTNNGIYFAILFLVWYASRHADRMSPLFQNRAAMSLFGGAMVTYVITKTFDRAYWSFIHGWTDWQDTMEESLETIAHLLILSLVVVSYVAWGKRLRAGSVSATTAKRRFAVWGLLAGAAAAAVVSCNHWYGEGDKGRLRTAGFPVELSSLCNVNPALGENLFLASSDEDHKLTLWTLDEHDHPVALKHLDLTVPLSDGAALHLDDLEDIAWDGHETYFAVASHRHLLPEEDAARRKKSHGTECALVSFQLEPSERGIAVVNATIVTQELLSKIRSLGAFPAIDWKQSKMFSWRGMVKTWQLDIEGLAFVDDGLLLGFKDPIVQGAATILRYDLATDELTVAARPDLGGHGILGLHYDEEGDKLYLLSNDPIKHRFGDSCLWIGTRGAQDGEWTFSPQHKVVIEAASRHMRRKASGITVHDGKVAVCFDSETDAPIQVVALPDLIRR
jgi:hypothetical protein